MQGQWKMLQGNVLMIPQTHSPMSSISLEIRATLAFGGDDDRKIVGSFKREVAISSNKGVRIDFEMMSASIGAPNRRSILTVPTWRPTTAKWKGESPDLLQRLRLAPEDKQKETLWHDHQIQRHRRFILGMASQDGGIDTRTLTLETQLLNNLRMSSTGS